MFGHIFQNLLFAALFSLFLFYSFQEFLLVSYWVDADRLPTIRDQYRPTAGQYRPTLGQYRPTVGQYRPTVQVTASRHRRPTVQDIRPHPTAAAATVMENSRGGNHRGVFAS